MKSRICVLVILVYFLISPIPVCSEAALQAKGLREAAYILEGSGVTGGLLVHAACGDGNLTVGSGASSQIDEEAAGLLAEASGLVKAARRDLRT